MTMATEDPMPENANPIYTPEQRAAYRPDVVALDVELRHEHWRDDTAASAVWAAVKAALEWWRPLEPWRGGISNTGAVDCHSSKMSYAGQVPGVAMALPPRSVWRFRLDLRES